MKKKGLDIVVLNTAQAIASDHVNAKILTRNKRTLSLKRMTKWHLANRILDECLKYMNL